MQHSFWELVERGEMLRYEALRIDKILENYAHNFIQQDKKVLSPIDHHDMVESAECGCAVCTEWIARKEDLSKALRFQPVGHRWSICLCDECRFIGRLHTAFMAATNKRDLLIEMAFYSKHHTKHPALVMKWFDYELKQPKYTAHWCAHKISQLSMDFWLQKCETALSGALSGRVFINVEMAA